MPVTVGELMEFLRQFPPETQVVIDVNTDEGVYLYVDDIEYTSDEGSTPGTVQVEISWNPEPGWVQRLLRSANETRLQLSMPPLTLAEEPGDEQG